MEQTQQMNKKGLTETFSIVQAVLVFLLLLAVISIALFMGLTSISSETVIPRTDYSSDTSIVNETITLNATAQTPVTLRNLTDCTFNSPYPILTNRTGGAVISANNYTVSGCSIVASGVASNTTNLTQANVTGFYSYTLPSGAVFVTNNVTNGVVSFFNNIPTVLNILGVVLIVAAITLIIVVVNRLRKGSSTETL